VQKVNRPAAYCPLLKSLGLGS